MRKCDTLRQIIAKFVWEMKYRQIEAFRYVMAHNSFSEAARNLNVTQPSISRLISDLEAEIGLALFERQRGRIAPTDDAMRFYAAVEQVFQGLERLDDVATRLRGHRRERLSINAFPAFSTGALAAPSKDFLARHPDIYVAMNVLSPGEIIDNLISREKLLAGDVDLAFSVRLPDSHDIVQVPLIEVEFVTVIPSGHPLAARDEITPQDLHGENFINVLPYGMVNWDVVENTLTTHGVVPRKRIGAQNAHTVCSLAEQGIGVGVIEPFAARTWARLGTVVLRPFRPRLPLAYVVAWPAGRTPSPLAQDFLETVRRHLRNDPSPYLNE